MEVRLFATLRENRGSVVDVRWAEGFDGFALLAELGLDAGDVSMFLINGMHSKFDTVLKADDVIALFPPLGGG